MGESYIRRILKERAVPKIEEYWYMTDHQHLRAAAAELLLNLLYCDDMLQDTIRVRILTIPRSFQKGTERIKLWVLYCNEDSDDDRLAMASSAGFVLISNYVEANKRILDEIKSWPELFKDVCMHENPEVQRRCLMAIANMMESDQAVCAEIVAVSFCPSSLFVFPVRGLPRPGGHHEARPEQNAPRLCEGGEEGAGGGREVRTHCSHRP